MTQLRLGLSHLHGHKFNHNFQNSTNPLCSCGMGMGSTSRCLLHFPLFGDKYSTSPYLVNHCS